MIRMGVSIDPGIQGKPHGNPQGKPHGNPQGKPQGNPMNFPKLDNIIAKMKITKNKLNNGEQKSKNMFLFGFILDMFECNAIPQFLQ